MNKSKKIAFYLFFIFTAFSCNKSKDADPSSATSIVGKWAFEAIGIKTDTKTVEATIADVKKIDNDTSIGIGRSSYDFKADGTFIVIDDNETETGKYVVDAGNKKITVTSDTNKDANGKPEVSTFEIVSKSNTSLVLGGPKVSKKNADGDFESGDEDQDSVTYFFGVIVFTAKGLDPDDEFAKAKSIQTIIKLKK